MLHSAICSQTGTSAMIYFSIQSQNKLKFLLVNGSQFQFHVLSFLNLYNLLYLNISSSNISNICFEESVFIPLKRLLILDLSANSISNFQRQCIEGPSLLQNIVINENPLANIETNSFYNLLNVSSLK